MKKLLVVISLVFALVIPVFADELRAPFTKIKELVAAKGVNVTDSIKAIEFQITDENISMISIMTSNKGNVGIIIINKNKTAAQLVAFDAEMKVYFVNNFDGNDPRIVIQEDAIAWAFNIFRILVTQELI